MSKKLGYTPAKGPDGSSSFSPKGSGSGNKHGNAPRQDGKNSDKSVQAGEHLSNKNGTVNRD